MKWIIIFLLLIPIAYGDYAEVNVKINNFNVSVNENHFSCDDNVDISLLIPAETSELDNELNNLNKLKLEKCQTDLTDTKTSLELCSKVNTKVGELDLQDYLNDLENLKKDFDNKMIEKENKCTEEKKEIKDKNKPYQILSIVQGVFIIFFILITIVYFAFNNSRSEQK